MTVHIAAEMLRDDGVNENDNVMDGEPVLLQDEGSENNLPRGSTPGVLILLL